MNPLVSKISLISYPPQAATTCFQLFKADNVCSSDVVATAWGVHNMRNMFGIHMDSCRSHLQELSEKYSYRVYGA